MDYHEALEMFERDAVDLEKRGHLDMAERYQCAIDAMKELQEYKVLNMTPKQIQETQIDYCATEMFLNEYRKLGTLEEVRSKLGKKG